MEKETGVINQIEFTNKKEVKINQKKKLQLLKKSKRKSKKFQNLSQNMKLLVFHLMISKNNQTLHIKKRQELQKV